MPGLSHWQHPQFFGYFPCNGTLASVLGDYVSTGLGVLGLAWQSSPALTELEEVVTDWMREMLGLSDAWSGVIQDTASTSTLIALICARERTHRLRTRAAAACRRSNSRSSSTPRRTATARSRRRRCSPVSAATNVRDRRARRRATRCGRMRWPMRSPPTSRRPDALRDRRHHRKHGVDGAGSHRRDRDDRRAARPLAARGCGDGRLRDDPARVPLDVERCRRRRLARRQPAQMAGRGVRLHAVLRARRRTSDARHVAPTRAICNRRRTAA